MTEAIVLGGRRVLVVEDEPKIARLIGRAFAAAGFEVAVAMRSARALAMLEESAYDLIILDLLLPDGDGFEVLDRSLELRPDQRVLVISALADVRTKVRCLELGACDYVTKPFELPEVVARARLRLQSRTATPEERYLRVGELTLDTLRRVVHGRDVPVALATREFLLLEYLMRSGSVCSREELLEHVWGYTFDPGTNVVEVCVGRLRSKLGGASIDTIRNVGYAIAA
jgi:two-component system copper resistance phosphate regulon response regulator CusR